jgi:Zn-dependent metalloprotease
MDIAVEGAGCIEHYDTNNSLSLINAKVADSIKKEHIPQIDKKETIVNLIESLRKDKEITFAWESEEWEIQIQSDRNDPNATWFPSAELIWSIDNYKNLGLIISGSRFTLAYKIPITTISPRFETITYFIDANTGAILKERSNQKDIYAEVYGYGNQWMDARWRGGFINKFELNTDNLSRNVHTKKFTSYSDSWNNMNETRKAQTNWHSTYLTETSAHFHVINSWNFFRNKYGRNGFKNNGEVVRVKTQLPEVNAYHLFVNGGIDELNFGYSPTNYNLSYEPSIIGHEFTHGIIKHTTDLEYEDEPGALNESFADIFGTVIQSLTLDNTYTDWIIGNSIPNSLQFQRSLIDPNSMGRHWSGSYDANGNATYNLGQPEDYNGNFYCINCPFNVDKGGIHINSGVQNKWFQTLTDGNSFVPGIGMNKAANIAYFAMTSLLMSSAQYTDSREATISVAINLYGECSQEHKSTVAAWNFVNVSATLSCNPLSVDENTLGDIAIYPNPTDGFITIELPREVIKPVEIFDVSGKRVKSFDGKGIYFKTNVSDLQKGVYFVNFTFKDRQVVKRIIVQ